MTDRAIDIIENIELEKITFSWLRSEFKVDNGLKDSLDRGHAVIDTVDKLDQYLYTHGLMIESQWENLAPYLTEIDQPTRWIDYGCGQGLAGLFVNDLTEGNFFDLVRDILLIEPSAVALARATALYGRLAPSATVSSVCSRFDDVRESDVSSTTSAETLHVFSNSLDVLGFDPIGLLTKTLRRGRHAILSVSHDREFNGGTPQIERVKAALEGGSIAAVSAIHRSTLERFTCNNPTRSKGLVWLCEFEVKDG